MPSRYGLALSVLGPVAVVMGLVLIGQLLDTYVQYVLCLCLIAMMIGVALVPLVGYAKVVMLAGGAMAGIGAYTSSLLILHQQVPFLLAVAVAAAAGGLSGFILGLPAIRFKGHHLAMVTLVFQALGILVLREWKGMTGGAEGIRVPPVSVLGYVVVSDASSLVLIGVFAAITVLAVGILLRGSFGKILRAIVASDVGSTAFGVPIGAYKVAAFTISSTFLAVSGAVLAPQLKIIDPDSFGLMQSINALAYPVVGGMTSVWGGMVGGGLLRALPETLRSFADYAELVFSGLALLVILLLPNGIVGAGTEFVQRFRLRRNPPVKPPPPAASAPAAVSTAPKEAPGVETVQAESRISPAATRGHGSADVPAERPADLEAIGISKSYGSLVAVDNVSMRVAAGSLHGLIGPNGAGKTTLFNAISGLTPADRGVLRLCGVDVTNAPAVGRIGLGVTRTFQHVAVFDKLSCLDNVVIGLGENGIARSLLGSVGEVLNGLEARRRREAAEEALAVVGLGSRSRDVAGSLSLGDQRRLEVARAIASGPRLLLLDEPVSGVSREDEDRLMVLLRDLNAKTGLTMLLIEHNIRFVVGCCDQLSVMHQGAIVTEGVPASVIASDQVQQIYFGRT